MWLSLKNHWTLLFVTTFFRKHRPWVFFLVWGGFWLFFILFLGLTFLMFFLPFCILLLRLFRFMGCKFEFYMQECTIPGDCFSAQYLSSSAFVPRTYWFCLTCILVMGEGSERIWRVFFWLAFFLLCCWFFFIAWFGYFLKES